MQEPSLRAWSAIPEACKQTTWDFNNSIKFRVFVLVPIRFASEAWPRAGLAEPRSASIAGFGNTGPLSATGPKQAGTRGCFGFVFGTWNWYDFWGRSWGLPCSRPLLPPGVGLMRFYIGTAQLKPDLQGGTGFNLLRVQFLDPRAKETCLKRGQKVDPLEIKSGRSPLEGPVLAPSLWQIFWSVYFKLMLTWPATAASGSLNWGGPFLRACFFLRFED